MFNTTKTNNNNTNGNIKIFSIFIISVISIIFLAVLLSSKCITAGSFSDKRKGINETKKK